MPRPPKILFLANWPRTQRSAGNYAFFAHWSSRPRIRFFGSFSLGPWTRLEQKWFKFYVVQPLVALFRAPFYDAVIAYSSQCGLPLAALLRLCFWMRTKLLVFDVESFGRVRAGWKLGLIRFASRRIDHLLYASRAQEKYYDEVLPQMKSRRTFIPLGIGPYVKRRDERAGENGPLLALGQHGHEFRDWATLLSAYALINSPVDLMIVGRDSIPEADRAGVPIPEGVKLVPYQPMERLQDYVEQARCVILPLPEREQSLGQLTLLFAMAMGKAVVAARIIGLTDYLTDGLTGMFYEPGNAADLARCLRRLLDDPARALRLGREARRQVESRFTDQQLGRTWEDIFYRVTGLPR